MKHLYGTALSCAMILPGAAFAQETIDLTVASSHPTVIPWVGMIQTHFMARTDEILAESGNYEINWYEAFGGQLYKANATLDSVEQGITDIGWVFSFLEPAKLPMSQASSYAPFSTADASLQLEVMSELFETNEAFRNEWEQYNLKVLGFTGTDSYDVYAKEELGGFSDLEGMKLSAPGVLGNWLRGTGANAVDGALTTFYTDIQTGVSDGVLSLALGVLPAKIYEVAPYIHRYDLGVAFSGAVAINRDSWDGLPEEVQNAMIEAGEYYTESHGTDLNERHEAALDAMVEAGAEQSPQVQIIDIPEEEREAWVQAMPNIAKEWADGLEEQGVPAREFMRAYMDGLRERGAEPVRAWDDEL
ncbi:C4-dicarboxylate-binding periplasmic protein precursor [Roseivivax jejudonensis]|uniref:C4-dicarboxylate-binding periplasmic protein n=1 Tax=Roseivivax jejudonensis TaxID=1529041 RepID=A0A1X6ZVD8_9RHOB|nr:C4-dicarboxylate TRAP transporter substrate-binding protein [Roseivivax jejudonensis]SLN62713.1 C4-dicarboxylate-binding periplasmic protein precursor [Roseivivax jejudonensis]